MREMFHNWWLTHQLEYVLAGLLLTVLGLVMGLLWLVDWWTRGKP